jgi:hypothetical protein
VKKPLFLSAFVSTQVSLSLPRSTVAVQIQTKEKPREDKSLFLSFFLSLSLSLSHSLSSISLSPWERREVFQTYKREERKRERKKVCS